MRNRPLDGKTAGQRLERWRGEYTMDFKRSYVQVHGAHLNLLVGRDWLFWGASPYKTVGISDHSPAFDQVRLTGTFGKRLKATAFTTQLDSTWYDDGKKRYLAKRYMSGHRLDYQYNDRVEIGVAEWILYGGDAQTLEWKYANPFTFYYALQYNAKADDNVMFAVDAAIRPMDGVRLYGEWVIDDSWARRGIRNISTVNSASIANMRGSTDGHTHTLIRITNIHISAMQSDIPSVTMRTYCDFRHPTSGQSPRRQRFVQC